MPALKSPLVWKCCNNIPNYTHSELSAITDALNNLRVLEREEERLAAEDKKRILQETVQRLKTIAPKLGEPEQQC
jgi:hypothetical protein